MRFTVRSFFISPCWIVRMYFVLSPDREFLTFPMVHFMWFVCRMLVPIRKKGGAKQEQATIHEEEDGENTVTPDGLMDDIALGLLRH